MRACELTDLKLSEYDKVDRSLTVLSKGCREVRPAYLTPTAIPYVEAWLATGAGGPAPPSFPVVASHLDSTRINDLLRRLGRVAGVDHYGSHDFRMTLATRLMRTTDTPTVMRVLGQAALEDHALDTRAARADPQGDYDHRAARVRRGGGIR